MHLIPNKPVAERTDTDEELMKAMAVDPTNALAALYDRYAGLVFGLAAAILTSPQEAEDLTHEIFLALCNRWDYDPRRGPLRAFLITMTRSRAIDRIRAGGRRRKLVERWSRLPAPESAPFQALDDLSLAECSLRVRAALAELPDHQRKVLELAYYKDLSQTEIARELEAPLGTVKSWARQGLFRLRRSLQDLCG
jgi:RNA polymerase sigma-70 factor, ECF subfamily